MPVARTHEKALVRQVDFDLIAAEPLPEFADVLTLDQHTVFGKAGGQIVVREAGQGELMVVLQAAHLDMAFANGLEVEARYGVGRFVVAHAENTRSMISLKKSPDHTTAPSLENGARLWEPRGVVGGELVGTAALFEDHRAVASSSRIRNSPAEDGGRDPQSSGRSRRRDRVPFTRRDTYR